MDRDFLEIIEKLYYFRIIFFTNTLLLLTSFNLPKIINQSRFHL